MKSIAKIPTRILFILLALMVIAACSSGSSNSSDSSDISNSSDADSSASGATDYAVVDTGQAACYNDNGEEITFPESGEAFYGQDAQFIGNQPDVTDNGDGTVTDNIAGLVWQQTPENSSLSYEEAENYCEALELAGYDDWRVPTTKELFSISDFLRRLVLSGYDLFRYCRHNGQQR